MQDSQIQIQVKYIYDINTHTNTSAMHKYSSIVTNVGSMGCLRGEGNAYYPNYVLRFPTGKVYPMLYNQYVDYGIFFMSIGSNILY